MAIELIVNVLLLGFSIFCYVYVGSTMPESAVNELACAVGMAYGQAGLPEPEPELGMEVEEFQQRSLETLKERALPEGKLLDAIQEYSRRDEQMDEDMLAVLKLGYESGRQ